MSGPSYEIELAATAAPEAISETLPSTPGIHRTLSPEAERGGVFGRYVTLSRLGAGAMGVVFAAYDPELDRKVALKLLKTQSGDSTRARKRLLREAQALARLHHPNVVSVFDVGIHEGQLFIAMEFVHGATLGAWMESLEAPRSWRDVLAVFLEAGRGLAAAHEAGLVHRDFKPENVMIGDEGRVLVMDFGLARVGDDDLRGDTSSADGPTGLDANALTQTGALMGTPAYMSNEQFAGRRADARSDQFAFCVSLYEALYGERPFAGDEFLELMQAVERGSIREAPRDSSVPSWLRRVLVRGLDKEPERRWPSMESLLRALADDPVKRRRRALAVAALGLAVVGAGAGVTSAARADVRQCVGFERQLDGTWDSTRRAAIKDAIEGTGLSYARETWARVQPLLEEYAESWVEARVDACEATRRGEQSGELLDLRMACLDDRLRHMDATVAELLRADDSAVKHAVSAMRGLPRIERCADVDALKAAIPPPEDPVVAARVVALDELLVEARAKLHAGRVRASLALAERVAAEAETLSYEPLRARAWLLLGEAQSENGAHEEAVATLERALDAAMARTMTTQAANVTARLVYVVGHEQAQHERAHQWAALADSLSRAAGTDEARARYLDVLGLVLRSEGKLERSRQTLERALSIRTRALGPDDPSVANSLNNVGGAAFFQGQYEDAREFHERALALRERALGPGHPDVADSLNNLGAVAGTEGRHSEARDYFEHAYNIWERALGPEHPRVASSLNNLGLAALAMGSDEQARGYFERALVAFERVWGAEHPNLAAVLSNLGKIAEEKGAHADARRYFTRALEIVEQALGPEHDKVADALMGLGAVARSEGRLDDARRHQERALSILERSLGPQNQRVVNALVNLGNLANDREQHEPARRHFERALTIVEQTSADSPRAVHPLLGLGIASLGLGEFGEALRYLERARLIGESSEISAPLLASTRFALARALWGEPGRGRDRARARRLAQLARDAFADAGANSAGTPEDVDAWLKSHVE